MRGSRIAAPIGGVVAGGASIVCMASMGAMVAASTAGATAGMAGMGAAAAAAATTTHVPAVTHMLRAVGLGELTHIPNAVLQPLLLVLLLVAIGAALWRARVARTIPALALALLIIAAAAVLYASIYITISETGYWIALVVLILASVLSAWPRRRRSRVRAA